MYDLYYNFLSQELMLGSAMNFQSTEIICRYASIVLVFVTFWFLMSIAFAMFKWFKSWF